MIYLLFICLVVVLIVNYILNKKDIAAPAVVFAASFAFSSAWAVLYAQKWQLNTFHLNTFFVILGGVLILSIVCFIVKILFNLKSPNKEKCIKTELKFINLNIILKILFLLFFVAAIFISLKSVIDFVGGSWNDISGALSRFDAISKFSNKQIVLPRIAVLVKILTNALIYVLMYIMINNFLCTKKIDFFLGIDIIIGSCINLTTGGRNGIVNIFLAFLAIFILLYNKNNNGKVIFKKKNTIIAMISLFVIFLVVFPVSVKLMGRKNLDNPIEYLSIYCGAEIKNLDIYLDERTQGIDKNSGINQTFMNFNSWIDRKMGKNVNYKLDLPFRTVGEYNLGNVYTTFYQYIYDYGYYGVVVCVGIMALILQVIYEISLRAKSKDDIMISIIIYGYMFSSIVLSFFSNKFYEQNFTNTFIYNVIIWTAIKYFIRYKDKIIQFRFKKSDEGEVE